MRELTSRISQSPSKALQATRSVAQGVEFFAHTPMSGLLPGPRPPRQVAALSLVKLVGFLAAPHQAVTMISSASHSATQLAWLHVVRTT